MSWISDLAGKAENILNKIDQNAASVLKPETTDTITNTDSVNSKEIRDESKIDGLRKNLSSSSLSLTKSLSPKKFLKSLDLQGALQQRQVINDDQLSQKDEKSSSSRLSSRRSSISSKTDSTIASEKEIISITETDADATKQMNNISNPEKELTDLRIILAETTSERNDLREEIIQLQNELKETSGLVRIKELERLVNELNVDKQNLSAEIAEMKINCTEYVKSITELETNLSMARQKVLELSEKLDWKIREVNQHVAELEQYRKKAQTTLQMKDKIIAELQMKIRNANSEEGGANSTTEESAVESDAEKILHMEIKTLRQENLNLNEELNLTHFQLEESRRMINQFEQRYNDNIRDRDECERTLRDALSREQQRALQFESDVKILNQELLAVREEMHNQRQLFSMKLHEKDAEIAKMHAKQANASEYSDMNGLEERVQTLTQALVQKQSAIEAITAERNALKLQLEKTDDKIRQLIAQNKKNQVQIINVNDTDDVKAQLPFIMRENPFDTNVTRRVKRAYSSLDSAGIRVGVFLRRYPLIRTMVFVYVALLHLWVMFVLLSSTPS